MNTVNVGFNSNDEVQFDIESNEDLMELFANFCIESGYRVVSVDYIEDVTEG